MTPTYLLSHPATPDDFVIALIHPVRDTSKQKPIKQATQAGATLMRFLRVAGTVIIVETRYESDPYHIEHLEGTGRYGKDGWYVNFKEVDDRQYAPYERIVKGWLMTQVFSQPTKIQVKKK